MKKGTKGMLIAAGAFAVAGVGFCIGGISVAAVETGGESCLQDSVLLGFLRTAFQKTLCRK